MRTTMNQHFYFRQEMAFRDMTDSQCEAALALLGASQEVEAHLDRTWFAGIGGTAPDAVFYYRIRSPVVLIEFDHQQPANLRHLYGSVPNRQHIHVVVRTPNGNDYGKDLLRQHHERRPHPH